MNNRFVLMGTSLYLGATASAYFYFQNKRATDDNDEKLPVTKNDLCRVVSTIAPEYDRQIWMDEFVMGVGVLRWWLLRNLTGRILEVSCGTGRNLLHYNERAVVTATDVNPTMLEIAREKAASKNIGNVEYMQADAENLVFEDNSFDVVIDTFGLCSAKNPELVVKEMQRVCKPDGKIILLEHGRSQYDFINRILDDGADRHATKWGCFWNRQIDQIVRDSGIHTDSAWRAHFGTTYVYEGTPGATGK
eukprot:m.153064 g.153064  ORF g.153064 m.153064 type:complete len:248 (-) comp17904_c0_seq2:732-1475(-)